MKRKWFRRQALLLLAALALALAPAGSFAEAADECGSEAFEPAFEEREIELGAPEAPEAADVADAARNEGEGALVTVSPATLKVPAGDTRPLTVTFLAEQDHKVYWQCSDKSVADCQWGRSWVGDVTTLYVTGIRKGTATVTVTNDVNSDVVSVRVKVTGAVDPAYPNAGVKDGKATCRALLIGQEDFNPICTRNRGDVTLMGNMLKKVRGSDGVKWSVSRRYNLSATGVKNAIGSTFKKADKDDVSLFFIATHGDSWSTQDGAGALSMVPGGSLRLGELAAALKAVPGKVVVILESCGSGAGVYVRGQRQNAVSNAVKSAVRAFDQAAIDAFANADPGIVADDAGLAKPGDGAVANTGELRRRNKFYVLTASRYREDSWGDEKKGYNYFTLWLTDGVGLSGGMPADKNGNGRLTLKEMFKYISAVGDKHPFKVDGDIFYQHVQVYPKNSGFVLFCR